MFFKLTRPFFLYCVRFFVNLFYSLKITGLSNSQVSGKKLYICNHTSLMDAVVIAISLKKMPYFVMAKSMAEPLPFSFSLKFIFNRVTLFFLNYVTVFLIDEKSSYTVKHMIQAIEDGTDLMIFPEGRITVDGARMKIYEGAGMIAGKTGATIIPMQLNGLEYTYFSYMKGILPQKLFSNVELNIYPGVVLNMEQWGDITLREKRSKCAVFIDDLMAKCQYESYNVNKTLFASFTETVSMYKNRVAVEDHNGQPLTYRKLEIASIVLGDKINNLIRKSESITGVLLPNSVGATVTYFGLMAYGNVFHPMNISTGYSGLSSICKTLEIKNIVTSRFFVEKAKIEILIEKLSEIVNVIYLEDIKATVNFSDKISAILTDVTRLPGYFADSQREVIALATSGSEGSPKGVLLSHKNILSDCLQIKSIIDFTPKDIVFNALPTFHSFGFTGGLILPLLNGLKTYQYPSPLHYRIVPHLIYNTQATVCFGTDTFLNGWAKYANPLDFRSMRYMVAGAEKVKESTRKLYAEKFGVRILEGYGATETSPVLALNTPKYNKLGSVGKILPAMKTKLEDVPGVEGKKLLVSGPNVMMGYILASEPGKLIPAGEWYDTGDIVTIDNDGYITIQGRAKRFAKIAGEMVSLNSAESLANAVYSEMSAVIAVPDDKKGEQIVLFTQKEDANMKDLLQYARGNGIPEIMVPRKVVYIKKLPLLGTGKVNYPELSKMWNDGV